MKKWMFCLVVLIFIVSITFVLAEVRINEVMAHPSSTYEEWVELYNNGTENLTLTLWKVSDGVGNNKKNFSLNISAGGFALIVDDSLNCSNLNILAENCFELNEIGLGLNDGQDNLSVYNNDSQLISNFSWTSTHINRTWQYCSGNWIENNPTPGAENNCTQPPTCTFSSTCGSWSSCSSSSQTQTCINTSTSCVNTTYTISRECDSTTDITIELEWTEEDIVNGDEFDITVNVENLESETDYDILIEIVDDDDDVLSETYGNHGEDEDNWESSSRYVLEIFSGSGDDSGEITIRIDSDSDDFYGGATIIGKIRETGKTSIIDEFEEDIEILENEEDSDSTTSSAASTTTTSSITSTIGTTKKETISLGTGSAVNSGMNTQNSMIYKSKNEYIKEYAPYAFSLLCIFLIALLLIDKRR